MRKYTRLNKLGIDHSIQANFPQSSDQLWQRLEETEALPNTATSDGKTREIIYAWLKLQNQVLNDIKEHNQNFISNETSGFLDERGKWIDASEFNGGSNHDRFLQVAGGEEQLKQYEKKIIINSGELFDPARPELANSCTAINNLFIKPSEVEGKVTGGDLINATAHLDTTKLAGNRVEDADSRAKYRSVFDNEGKTRKGYYAIQGGSERMLLHAVQRRLLEFNETMRSIIE